MQLALPVTEPLVRGLAMTSASLRAIVPLAPPEDVNADCAHLQDFGAALATEGAHDQAPSLGAASLVNGLQP